jgi:hypothetical protein
MKFLTKQDQTLHSGIFLELNLPSMTDGYGLGGKTFLKKNGNFTVMPWAKFCYKEKHGNYGTQTQYISEKIQILFTVLVHLYFG